MKRLVVAACGAAALGLTTFASGAGAAPLNPMNPAPAGTVSGMTEDVRWRQVCRPVWRGPVRVVNCRNVWVGGPPRGPGYQAAPWRGGPGPRYGGPPPGPRYGWGGGPPPGPRYY